MAILIDPWRIPEEGMDYEGDEKPELLALDSDAGLEAKGPVHYELHVQLVGKELIVTGELGVEVGFACSRCDDRFTIRVEEPSFCCEKEIENLHETLDLTDEIRETIILAFPNYPLCGDSCRGLCPRCGVNRNRETCGCKPLETGRWSAFSGLDRIEVKNGST